MLHQAANAGLIKRSPESATVPGLGISLRSYSQLLAVVAFTLATCFGMYYLPLEAEQGIYFCGFMYGAAILVCRWICGPADGLAIASLVFMLGHIVGLLLTLDRLEEFGHFTTYSDDWCYLTDGNVVAGNLLHGSTSLESLLDGVQEVPHYGFILFLGVLFAAVGQPDMVSYSAACCVNLFALSIIFALIKAIMTAEGGSKRTFYFCAFCVCPELFLFAADLRKDTIIILLLVSSFYLGKQLATRRSALALVQLAGVVLVLYFFRKVYVLLPVAVLPFMWNTRYSSRQLVTVVLMSTAMLLIMVFPFFIIEVLDLPYGFLVEDGSVMGGMNEILETGGLTSRLYSLPVVGPLIYFVLAPLPVNPLGIVTNPSWLVFCRSSGSLLLYTLYVYTLQRISKPLWQNPWFVGAFAYFVGIIVLAAVGAYEFRHKVPSLPFLAVMACVASAAGERRLARANKQGFGGQRELHYGRA